MRHFLLLTVSALALAQAVGAPRAEDLRSAEEARFATELGFGPAPTLAAPAPPSHAPGLGAIADRSPRAIDTLTTGQIAAPGAEASASELSDPEEAAFLRLVEAAESAKPPPDVAEDEVAASGEAVEAAAGAGDAPHGEASEEGKSAEGEASHEAPGKEGEEHHDPAFPAERGPMPFDIIRTIQFLQDQVARGNGRAIQVQAFLLRRFGPVFVDADPAVWTDPRNKRAAVLFVLSGGPPEVLRELMAKGAVDAEHEPIFKGALAYVENDLATAQTILSGLDFEDMEPGLEAHLNLVIGQMKQVSAPKDAIPHLDRARLLAPGGLIEEAALRMEMLIVDKLGDHAFADQLARQYFDRYARSAYSANFEARFASIFASRGKSDPEAAFATMLDVTERLADPNKRAIYLAVGRRALFDGHLKFAGLSADAALATEGIGDADRQRALLYTIAARIGSAPEAETKAQIATVDRARLHPEDAVLYDAAEQVLAGIDRSPDLVAEGAETERFADTSPVFDRAQQVLNEVADDLGKVQP